VWGQACRRRRAREFNVFKIGDFSRLSKVSVRALRHYDRLRLLEPADVDGWTGYRYYSASQLPRLNRIVALKEMGFSLDEVAVLLDDDLTVEEMRGMLKAKRAELDDRVRDEKGRLALVEARLRLIEREGEMAGYEVVMKEVDAVKVASIRDVIPSYPEQEHLWKELCGYLKERGVKPAGPYFTMYHDTEFKERDVDAEVCGPISEDVPEADRVKVRTLPPAEVASVVHNGPYENISGAYEALMWWVDENGCRIAVPEREIYIVGYFTTKNTDEFVTEIQVHVEKDE
jgi:effector-binding domain-containing protein